MSKQSSVCVLVSGGLDSAVLLARIALEHQRVFPIYIQQELVWETAELYWLRKYIHMLKTKDLFQTIQPLHVFSMPMREVYGDHWSMGKSPAPGYNSPDEAVYLPGRNMLLSIKAAVFCALHNIPVIALGSLGGNPFPDARREFFDHWAKSLSMGLKVPLTLFMPFRAKSKADVIQEGQNLPLWLSFSCIDPSGLQHCGRCNKCAERRRAFRAAGVPDKTVYAKN
jgi:7-cyano-7-deazaguanine synthase